MTDREHKTSVAGVDKIGAVCSTLCALHCASTAAIPSVMVALGLGTLIGPAFEWGFIVVAILFAAVALMIGWRRHRVVWILFLFAAGIVGLVAGRLLEAADFHGVGTLLSIASGVTLVVGHSVNILLERGRSQAR